MNLGQQRAASLRNHLKVQYKEARVNLALGLVLTLLNVLLLFVNAGLMFLFSMTVPYLSLLFGLLDETGMLLIPCALLTAALLVTYGLCWFFSKKNSRWLTAALILFIIDTVGLVAFYVFARDFTGIWDLLLHCFLLYYLITGVRAAKKLEQLPPEETIYTNDFRLEDDPGQSTVMPKPVESRTTDWKYDFSTLPQRKNRAEIPYIYDAFLSFEKAELLFCVTSVAEVSMMNYRGFFSVLENKESPRVVFASRKAIFGPNLYCSKGEEYLCFEAFCKGKGSVMLLYSVSRKSFAVLERFSGNLAGACFSDDAATVTLVEGDGSSLQFAIDVLPWLPLERLESTLESMESSAADAENL